MEFRKRLTDKILAENNEMIAEYNTPGDPYDPSSSRGDDVDERFIGIAKTSYRKGYK